LFPVKC
jgi:hypothetical protein